MSRSLRTRFSLFFLCGAVAIASGYQIAWREHSVGSAPSSSAEHTPRHAAKEFAVAGHRLIRILDDPQRSYKEREEAAQGLAQMKFIPAIPAFIRNLDLVDPKGIWEEDTYYPCRDEFKAFGQAAYPYLYEALHDPELSRKHQIEMYSKIDSLKQLSNTIASIEDELQQPLDPQTERLLRIHLGMLKGRKEIQDNQPPSAKVQQVK